jgi:hypothetical protein
MGRIAHIAVFGALTATVAQAGPEASPNGVAEPVPVLIELYTSEGCSSCPPADRLLAELSTDQPIASAHIVALGEHVDYWDDLGWRDRFSAHAFTVRQSESERLAFGSSTIYTPQIVVDGVLEAVGSDASAVRAAIARAVRQPKGHVRVTTAAPINGEMPVTVALDLGAVPNHETADVLLAVTEDALSTDVHGGENRGRTLTHTAVVRRLAAIGVLKSGELSRQLTTSVRLDPDWHAANLRVVAFVQERHSRQIRGAASTVMTAGARSSGAADLRSAN